MFVYASACSRVLACTGSFILVAATHLSHRPPKAEDVVQVQLPLRANLFIIRHLQAKTKRTISNVQLQYADYAALLACSPAAIQHVMYDCFSLCYH